MASPYLVATRGVVVAAFDRGSPVNRRGFLERLVADARRAEQGGGDEDLRRARAVQERFLELARQRQMMTWEVLIDGVFRVELRSPEAAASAATPAPDPAPRRPGLAGLLGDLLSPRPRALSRRRFRGDAFPGADLRLHLWYPIVDLDCPSGELIVACMSRVGEEGLRTALFVEPGTYRVALLRDMDAEGRHALLERDEDFPPDDPPDWVLTLSRQADGPGEAPWR